MGHQAGEGGWASRQGHFLPSRALSQAWFLGSMEETQLPSVASGCLVFSGRQTSGIAFFISGAELRGKGRTCRGSLITLVWKRADRVTSSLVHSVDLCVPRVSSVVGRHLKGAVDQGCPWRWGRRAQGSQGDRSGPPRKSPRGQCPHPHLGAGCRPLGPHRGARSPRERGCVEGRPILADLLWVRGRRKLAAPWATEGLAPAPGARSL